MDDLPEPVFFAPQMITEDAYSAAQMREMRDEERKRCRKVCADLAWRYNQNACNDPSQVARDSWRDKRDAAKECVYKIGYEVGPCQSAKSAD